MSDDHPAWKLALFDLDGTLVNTIDLIVQGFTEAYAQVLGVDIPRRKVLTFIGLPMPDVMAAEAPEHSEQMQDCYYAYINAHHDEMVRPYPGMVELVTELAERGVQTAVVTAKRTPLATHGLRLTGYPETISVVSGMEDTVKHKPEPEPLLAGLAKVGVQPSEAVYIGDAIYDLQAAAAVPMDAIGVTWGAGEEAAMADQRPMAMVNSAAELRRALLG
ncbi:pyrophosphatase PpaX [Propionibacterium cyclohexanicum]|uniref:Pyrophosphatase PpaX n=1 Tax=Propionibacterium cyclohexanicum TaxID=64702 RepID=A0A1H9RX34_9ACTN|nr:HAD-IA family hydrolase [Propionibacterium cyclohexanicum]SER77370.1 pyrophosphatase PpaX [Propionibacterium cyclohexanicum]